MKTVKSTKYRVQSRKYKTDAKGNWQTVIDFSKIEKGGVSIEKILSRL